MPVKHDFLGGGNEVLPVLSHSIYYATAVTVNKHRYFKNYTE